MNYPFYEFSTDNQSIRFTFESVGKSVIPKRVFFQKTDIPNLFNLVMGDIDDFGKVDAYSESKNGDMESVLATVIQIIIYFLTVNKGAMICIQGSTPSRTRLYRILINRELAIISEHFELLGFTESDLEMFQPGKSYLAFVISSKNV